MRVVYTLLLALTLAAKGYDLVRDYSGSDFFNGWDFYGSWDNLTLGDVWWLDEADATNQHLAYINNAGNAIIKVDNTSDVAFNQKRNTVRITTQQAYDVGSLWIIDAVHLPYGCSVWPAFWTKGQTWPDDGEIDIIEAINVMPNNQMALHTLPGCTHSLDTPNQSGHSVLSDCSTGSGCVVSELHPNSYESGFAAAGGGVWATQFDVAGVFIWFWSRPNVPASITAATVNSSTSGSSIVDLSQWGPPSASYTSDTCNITKYFTPQNLVLDITLCGDWAGVPSIYGPACGSAGPTGLCYNDNVVGPGSPKYDNAYFEISYVRAYTTVAANVGTPTQAPTSGAPLPGAIATTTPVTGAANGGVGSNDSDTSSSSSSASVSQSASVSPSTGSIGTSNTNGALGGAGYARWGVVLAGLGVGWALVSRC